MSLELSYGIAILFLVVLMWTIWKIGKDFEKPIQAILLAGLLVRVIHFLGGAPGDQANDWGAHIEYSGLLANGNLPKAGDCFECYHPPVYHLVNAGFMKPFEQWNVDMVWGLQWVSLCFFALAMVGFVSFLRKIVPEKKLFYLATAILVFWPRGIPLSITINNDLSMYLFTALALSALVTLEKQMHFAAFSAMALLSKTNGILLYPIFATHEFFAKKKVKIFSKANAVLVGGLLLSLGFTFYSRGVLTQSNAIIGNTDTIPPVYRVQNDWDNYVCFEIGSFLKYPDIGLMNDRQGRNCFWNFLLKTSLVTEKDVTEPIHQELSLILSALLLVLIAISSVGAVVYWRVSRQNAWLLNLNLFWFIAALMVIRYLKPMGAANDFRYVFPVIPSIATFAAYGVSAFSRHRIWGKIATFFLWAFIGISILYYLIPLQP